MSKTIKIDELIPLLKKGWVAMDKTGDWYFFDYKPKVGTYSDFWYTVKPYAYQFDMFNIEPYQGDWKKSLRRIK